MASCSSPPLRLRPSEEIITRIDDPPTELVVTLDSPASERHEAAAQQYSSLVHAEESGRRRTVLGSAAHLLLHTKSTSVSMFGANSLNPIGKLTACSLMPAFLHNFPVQNFVIELSL
jgi:hypothetical protein